MLGERRDMRENRKKQKERALRLLSAIAHGSNFEEAARDQGISKQRVQQLLSNLYWLLDVNSIIQAVYIATKQGLIK